MATVRPSLTSEHNARLRNFVRLVYEMDQCRFIERYRNQPHKASGAVDENGQITISGPDYDWDDFRSFMTIFRKVGILEKAPTYLTKILKIAGRYASDDFRRQLASTRREVMATLKGYWTGMKVGGTVDGKDVDFNCSDILEAITNGMIFHEDPRHRPVVELFKNAPRWAYLWPAIHFKIIPIMGIALALFQDLWKDGILSDADYPEAWQASKQACQASKLASANV